MSNLHGDVDVTRADLTVTSRPWSSLRLRGSVTYDERDNSSKQAAFDSIVYADSFLTSGDTTNPSYGFERFRVFGSADYELLQTVDLGVGGEYRQLKRTGTEQEVSQEDFTDGWGRITYRPSGYVGFVLRGGAQEREPDKYDVAVAEDYGQNPLMRKYNMAYLFRNYGELVANVGLWKLPVTLGASAFYADDDYTKSQIGLRSGKTTRYGIDLNWAINDKLSAYVSGGQDKIELAAEWQQHVLVTRLEGRRGRRFRYRRRGIRRAVQRRSRARPRLHVRGGRLANDDKRRECRRVPDGAQPAHGLQGRLQLRRDRPAGRRVLVVVRALHEPGLGAARG